MAPEYFELNFDIKTYDVDFNNRLRVDRLSQFLQECASSHAALGGFGFDEMHDMQMYWVLSKLRIKIDALPGMNEKLRIKTWSKGVLKLYALRDFELYDSESKLIGAASSAWIILDAKKHRMIRPDSFAEKFPVFANLHALKSDFTKIQQLKTQTNLRSLTVGYTDLDINLHVNNTRYLSWALDSLDIEQHKKPIKYIKIDFMGETRMNQVLNISIDETDENNKTFSISDPKKEVARLEFQF